MAVSVSNEYKQVIYGGDAKNKLKLLFNNVELENADLYCEKLTVKSRIIPNGAKIFSLNNFVSKEADLILHDIDTSIIQDQVSISIGTLVGNAYEYVPIGIFNIQDQPTNDKNKTTIKLRDNSVKFDFNYNAQDLIEANNGRATKLQILQDICTQASVACNITSFIGYLDEIGVYDNTVTARQYIANIAEQAGKIATINRSGELVFIDLNDLTTWEIPIDIVEKYENGTTFKIGKVVYEDGIVRYETDDSNDDTLFLDGSNNYINGELVKEQASSNNNTYYLQNTGEADLAYYEMEGKTTQKTRSGINLLKVTAATTTDYGVTFTINDDKSITINGTNTKNGTLWFRIGIDITLASGTYTLSNGNPNVNYNTFLFYDDSGNIPANGNVVSKTLSSSVIVKPYIRIGANQTINNQKIYPMIVKGEYTAQTMPSYEPYGIMPSPEFPSNLSSVGYNNLFNPNDVVNGYTSDNTGVTSGNGISSNYIKIEPQEYYYIMSSKDNGNWGAFYDINKNYVGGINSTGWASNKKIVFSPAKAEYMRFTVSYNDNNPDYATNVMIAKSKFPLEYSPYGNYVINVKSQNKNILDLDDFLTISEAVYTKQNNIYTITSIGKGYAIPQPLNLKPNTTYTLSQTYQTQDSTNVRFDILKNGSVIGSCYATNQSELSYTFPTVENSIYTLRINYSNMTNSIMVNKPMLEENTQATTFEQHKSNSKFYILNEPLRSIGETKDLSYIKNNKLYIERKIGSKTLNGNETWNISWDGARYVYMCSQALTNSKKYSSATRNIICKSNYYPATHYDGGTGSIWNYRANDDFPYLISIIDNGANAGRILIKNLKITTLSSFITWLQNYNTEIQYILNEPYIEEIGEVELPNTYNNVSNIIITSNINTNTYLQYRKSKTQVEAILDEVDEFDIDSLKTGKILGNPAIDSYDLIQIHDKSRNLLGIPNVNYSGYGLTIKSENGIITINGTATSTITYDFNLISLISSSLGTLTKSLNASGTYNGLQTSLRNNSGGSVGLWTDNASNSTNTISANAYKFRIQINSGITINATIKPQIEVGNVETDYVPFKDETYTTLATNDLAYTGVLTNTFDTQIGEEAKEQNVFVNGEATFQKWARTQIDNVEGSITLQAGQIDEANGRINQTNLTIDSQGALLNVIANNSNIDIAYDGDTPISGEVREVTTTTGFTFNAEGMTIEDSQSNFKAQHRNTGTYYKDGDTIVGQYTKDGSKQKDLDLFGVYTYGKNDIDETPMFIAQLFTDGNGEEAFGHFYNRGD